MTERPPVVERSLAGESVRRRVGLAPSEGTEVAEECNTPSSDSARLAPASDAELEAVPAACAAPAGFLDLAPTDTWWAQRWIDNATSGEVAAMRELLS